MVGHWSLSSVKQSATINKVRPLHGVITVLVPNAPLFWGYDVHHNVWQKNYGAVILSPLCPSKSLNLCLPPSREVSSHLKFRLRKIQNSQRQVKSFFHCKVRVHEAFVGWRTHSGVPQKKKSPLNLDRPSLHEEHARIFFPVQDQGIIADSLWTQKRNQIKP